ncbi:prolyl aminopeptidase [Thalassotalea sp. 42_200_T64]|nr:prolyl aminopeptidase [Thalassotalea sp. 42_200_T64]
MNHQIYVEECGNPLGIPVVFLHGGPGSGCNESHRRFFDPKHYHIILFDQRGCGRSRPYRSLQRNTTAHLIQDIEVIRQHIGIKKWLIFGGSWGATLALYYAQHFPQQVSGLLLRGIFLARSQDIDWVYSENGAAKLFPDAWQQLVQGLPKDEQAQPLSAIYQQLSSDNSKVSTAMFNKLQHWEANLIALQEPPEFLASTTKDSAKALKVKASSIIQLYYSLNRCFINQTPLLESIDIIRHIPTIIIHGRYDMLCPLEQAWQLKQRWPEAKLIIVEMAGHVASEPRIIDALIKATDDLCQLK